MPFSCKDLDDIRADLSEDAARLDEFDGVLADCITWCDDAIELLDGGNATRAALCLHDIKAALVEMR